MASLFGLIQRLRLVANPPTVKAEEGTTQIRFGILGAAAIGPNALILPARSHPEVEVFAVAARDKAKAEAYAKKYGIPKVFTSYQELLDSPDINVVYNPLPNGLHYEWTMKALEAGKHVLLEKPSCNTAEETRKVFELAEKKELIVMEAFHYRFHPVVQKAKKIIESGEIGTIKSASSTLAVSGLFTENDIRFDFDLGGGSLMDMGCYTINSLRYIVGADPISVTSASYTPSSADTKIDRTATATFKFPENVEGSIKADLAIPKMFGIIPRYPQVALDVVGEKGTLHVENFVGPHYYHYITVNANGKKRTEKAYTFKEAGLDGKGEFWWTTYRHQLEVFVDRLKGRTPAAWLEKEDSIANIEWIEKVYEKLGIGSRPKSTYVSPSS